ncbi:hypothetical protein HAX54_001619, partial [Datura stramonium]|nr:hypothetical protein [Datura stramonium]
KPSPETKNHAHFSSFAKCQQKRQLTPDLRHFDILLSLMQLYRYHPKDLERVKASGFHPYSRGFEESSSDPSPGNHMLDGFIK